MIKEISSLEIVTVAGGEVHQVTCVCVTFINSCASYRIINELIDLQLPAPSYRIDIFLEAVCAGGACCDREKVPGGGIGGRYLPILDMNTYPNSYYMAEQYYNAFGAKDFNCQR
jgi:hypothetical protein